MNYRLKQKQFMSNVKANRIQNYSLTIQEMLEDYIDKRLRPFQINIEHRLELIYHDYHIGALKIEYYQCCPLISVHVCTYM
jgi:hypothetical protein